MGLRDASASKNFLVFTVGWPGWIYAQTNFSYDGLKLFSQIPLKCFFWQKSLGRDIKTYKTYMTEEGSELKISVGEISFYLPHGSNLEPNVKWIHI